MKTSTWGLERCTSSNIECSIIAGLGMSERSTGGRRWKEMSGLVSITEETKERRVVDDDCRRTRIVTSRLWFRETRSLANSTIGGKWPIPGDGYKMTLSRRFPISLSPPNFDDLSESANWGHLLKLSYEGERDYRNTNSIRLQFCNLCYY